MVEAANNRFDQIMCHTSISMKHLASLQTCFVGLRTVRELVGTSLRC